MALSNLTLQVRAKTDGWTKDLKQLQADGRALESAFKPIKQSFADFGKPLLAAGIGISAALVGLTKAAADYGDTIDQAAEKTGATTQQLSILKYAADQSNSSFDDVSTGLKFLSKNLFAAGTGSKEQSAVFKALGVSVKDSSGAIRPLNDVLLDVADRFKTLPDGPEKAALSMKLFGKQGEALIPLMNRGGDGIRAMGAEAEKLGNVLDPVSAKLGDQFNKSLGKIGAASLGFAVSVSRVLLPSLTSLADKATSSIVWVRQLADEFPGLTKAAAGLGLGLTGAGGLLLGASAVAAAIPHLLKGVLLLKGGLSSLQLAVSTVQFYGLGASITAVGAASLTAAIGVGVLGGAIGLGIGLLVNWLIEGTKARDLLDKLALGATRGLGIAINVKQAVNESKDLQSNTQKLSDALAKQGIIIERGKDDLDAWNKRVLEAARGTEVWKKNLDDHAVAAKNIKAPMTDAEKAVRDLVAAMEKAQTIKDPFADLKKSFEGSLHPAAELDANISSLMAHGVSSTDIIKVYSGKIVEAAAAVKALNGVLPDSVAGLLAQATAAEGFAKATALIAESRKTPLVQTSMEPMFNRMGTEAEQLAEDLAVTMEGSSTKSLFLPLPEISPQWNSITEKASGSLLSMQKHADDLGQSIQEMSKDSYLSAHMTELLAGDLQQASSDAEKYGIKLDDNTRRLANQAAATVRASERAKEFSQAWYNSIANLNTRIGESITAMIRKTKFDFKSLVDIAKDTATGMLSAFVSGLISPLTDSVARMGKKLAGSIADMVFGGKKSGGGGVADLAGGGILEDIKGIFGGGKKSAVPDLTGGVSAVGGAVGSGVGAGMKGVAGTLSSVASVAGIAGSVADLVTFGVDMYGRATAGRHSEDQLVKSQTAFDAQKAQILTMNVSASQKLAQIESLWTDFQKNLATFSVDSAHANTANQAFATESASITNIRADLSPWIDQEKPSVGGGITIENGAINFTIQATPGSNAAEIAISTIKELFRRLGLNDKGITAELLRIEDRVRKGVAGATA